MRRRPAPWTDDDGPPAAGPGDDAPRWPNAPEPEVDPETGDVINAKNYCRVCDSDSTLSYRCSECGADLTGDAKRQVRRS
jgi:hypothetical protein